LNLLNNLLLPTSTSIYSNPLRSQPISQLVCLPHLLNCSCFGKVNRFTDCIIGMFLKRCLQFYMPLRANLQRRPINL